ncbi:Fasciclin-2, partial [Gryllus bimaculatus]
GADPRIVTSSKPGGIEYPDRVDGILSWDEVMRSDDGLYACVATNPAGEAVSFGHLTVEFKPSFVNTPYADYWSWDGQIANITCLAECIPKATIRWFYNNRDLDRDRIPEVIKHGEGPQSWLEIPSSFQGRYGTYRCEAKNKLGTQSHFIIVGPMYDGGIPIRVYNVRYGKSDELVHQWRNRAWPADSEYVLEDLVPQTRYEFQFSAQNDVGTGPWGATQIIVMPKRSPPEPPPLLDRPMMFEHPEAPVDTPVMSAYPTHFELRWNIPADNGEPIRSYHVTWCT